MRGGFARAQVVSSFLPSTSGGAASFQERSVELHLDWHARFENSTVLLPLPRPRRTCRKSTCVGARAGTSRSPSQCFDSGSRIGGPFLGKSSAGTLSLGLA